MKSPIYLCTTVALLFLGTCATLYAQSLPDILGDFEGTSLDRAAIAKTLSETPDSTALATYRGTLLHAERAANEMSRVRKLADEYRRVQLDDDGRRKAADIAVAVSLVGYEDALNEVTAAVGGSQNDVLRFTICARAALALADQIPTRLRLAPIDRSAGPNIDRAIDNLKGLLLEQLKSGASLKESVLRADSAATELRELRNAAREYASAGLALRALATRVQETEWGADPAITKSEEWLRTDAFSRSHASIVRNGHRVDGNGTLKFPLADAFALVPWPFVLAQELGIGRIEITWDIAGVDPIDAKPETISVHPRMDVSAWFLAEESVNIRLPIYSLRLRGSPVDRFSLGDEPQYRKILKDYLKEKAPAQLPLADNPDLTAMRAALGGSPAKSHFEEFHRQVGLNSGRNLGENDLTYKLVERLWGNHRLNHEMYWLVRLPSLRDVIPNPPTTSPGPTGKSIDFSEDWRKSLGIQTGLVELPDVDVSAVSELIRRKIARRVESKSNAAQRITEEDPAWKRFQEAEAALLAADPAGKLSIAPLPGTFTRLLQQDLKTSRIAKNDKLRYQLPSWLPPAARFQRISTKGSVESLSVSPVEPSLLELLRVWNSAEENVILSVDFQSSQGWRQFLTTLNDLESKVIETFGESSIRPLVNAGDSFLKDLAICGNAHPKPVTGWLGVVPRELAFSSVAADLDTTRANLKRADAIRFEIAATLKLVEQIDYVNGLVGNLELWKKHCADHQLMANEKAVPPALPKGFQAQQLQLLQQQRNALLKTVQFWLNDYKAEEMEIGKDIVALRDQIEREIKPCFPESFATRNEVESIHAVDRDRSRMEGEFTEISHDVNALVKNTAIPNERWDWYRKVSDEKSESWAKRVNDTLVGRSDFTEAAEQWLPVLVKKFSADAKPNIDLKTEAKTMANHASAEVLARFGALREKGLPNEQASNAAWSTYLADGLPLQPAVEIEQALRMLAAEGGILLSTEPAK